MFEQAPFETCPLCGIPGAFGILSVESDAVVRRCKACRFSDHLSLPVLDKRVIYLDQPLLSNVYKVKNGTLAPTAPHADFWREATRAIDRAFLFQAAIFPASSVHMKETTVFYDADGLRLAHDMLSGDVEFINADDIEADQARTFAKAFLDGVPTGATFDIDSILEGERNAWIPKLHVSANMSFDYFASGIRHDRDRGIGDLEALVSAWKCAKPTFAQALECELGGYGPGQSGRFIQAVARMQAALSDASVDPMELVEATNSRAVREFLALKAMFESAGVDPAISNSEIARFWHWPGNRAQPAHLIAAHLFAAMASAVVGGKKVLGQGTWNDVKAISTFGPYVDAIWLDNEMARYLSDKRVQAGVRFKGPVFSMKTGGEFIAFLDGLVDALPSETRAIAGRLYGVE